MKDTYAMVLYEKRFSIKRPRVIYHKRYWMHRI